MPKRVGPYELRGSLGQGAMGSVYRAWDPQAGREVALKVLLGTGEAQRRRFQREAEALASLRHANIVSVQAAGETEGGHPYLVMDLVEGGSLADLLAAEGPLPPARAVELTWHLAQGLAHAHARGVLHRDLKPANVLLGADGRPRLTDFGLAKDTDTTQTQLTRSGHALGSPGYWPPEQARGEVAAIGPASDVYGLGAVLYALLTGRPPIEGDSLVEILSATLSRAPAPPSAEQPAVDPGLDAIVLRCLEKDPARRLPTVEALAEALDGWLLRARRRRPWGAVVAAGLAALALVGLLLAAIRTQTPPPAEPTTASPTPTPTPTSAAAPSPASPRAPQLWPLAEGGQVRFRLTRRTERGGGSQASLLGLECVLRRGAGRAFTLDVERLTLENRQGRLTIFAYDSAKPRPEHANMHARVSRLLGTTLRLQLDLRTGRVAAFGGVPALAPPVTTPDPAAQLLVGVLGVVSDDGLRGALETVWSVVPPAGAGERWTLEGPVWPAPKLPYTTRRELRRRGDAITVRGAAEASAAVIPPGMHHDYAVGDLRLRGRVAFDARGLASSRQVLRYAITVGNYPGPRTTTLSFTRLD